MSMKAEGEDAAVLAQAEQFLKYVKEAHKISFDVLPTIFRDGCRDPEEGVGEPECVGCNDDCESLARSAYTKTAPQKGATREVQCEHTFKITIPRCAPCGGYDKQCKHYRPKNK